MKTEGVRRAPQLEICEVDLGDAAATENAAAGSIRDMPVRGFGRARDNPVAKLEEMRRGHNLTAADVRMQKVRTLRQIVQEQRSALRVGREVAPLLFVHGIAGILQSVAVSEIGARKHDRIAARMAARSKAVVRTEPHARRPPRPAPCAVSQGHGWWLLTLKVNARPANCGNTLGSMLPSATSQRPRQSGKSWRCTAFRSLGSTVTTRCGRMPAARSGRTAVSTAMMQGFAFELRQIREVLVQRRSRADDHRRYLRKGADERGDIAFGRHDGCVCQRVEKISTGEPAPRLIVGGCAGEDSPHQRSGVGGRLSEFTLQERRHDGRRCCGAAAEEPPDRRRTAVIGPGKNRQAARLEPRGPVATRANIARVTAGIGSSPEPGSSTLAVRVRRENTRGRGR